MLRNYNKQSVVTSIPLVFLLERNKESAFEILWRNVKNLIEGILKHTVTTDSYFYMSGRETCSAA